MPCIECELPDLLLESIPPDQDMADLIEQAFLEGQIDGKQVDLAYLWLNSKQGQNRSKCYPDCYPKQ